MPRPQLTVCHKHFDLLYSRIEPKSCISRDGASESKIEGAGERSGVQGQAPAMVPQKLSSFVDRMLNASISCRVICLKCTLESRNPLYMGSLWLPPLSPTKLIGFARIP